MTSPVIAVGPKLADFAAAAIREGGGTPVSPQPDADALVWLDHADPDGLRDALGVAAGARWVQLPSAGIDVFTQAGLLDPDRQWTSAKGCYSDPVAELALTLALAGLRCLPSRITARSWGRPAGESLYDQPVTILGAGGITEALLELLAPMRVRATVVRRSEKPVPGAARTVPQSALHDALDGARAVFLALALTPDTEQIIGAAELAAMAPGSWLINVARGPHVDTDALVEALRAEQIGGAGLDVTDPEPLPDGHPLWELENCIITPHTANTPPMTRRLLGDRITDNVGRFAAGQPLTGRVDTEAGY